MFTFLTFVAGVITGVAGLVGMTLWRKPKLNHPPEHITVDWKDFCSEGLRSDPKFAEGALLPFPHRPRPDLDIDQMVAAAVGDINTNLRVTHTPKCLAPSDEATRLHEAGHVVMVLRQDPLAFHYAVSGAFRNTHTGDVLGGLVSHDKTDGYSHGLILYGGYAAEMVFLGNTDTVLMGSDLANAFSQAYFVYWNNLMSTRPLKAPWPPMHPWCALGALGAEHRDPAVLEAVTAICDQMRKETIRIITEERMAVHAIAEAFKKRPVLKRRDVFQIWEKFHPGEISRHQAAEERRRNTPEPTATRTTIKPTGKRMSAPAGTLPQD